MRTAFVTIRRALTAFAALAVTLGMAGPVLAQAEKPKNVQATLVAEKTGVEPGGTVTVALRFEIREHWHTYWIYSGDSGEATEIDWTLPAGVTAGPLQFPYPERIPVGPLVNFGYAGTVLHLTDITVPKDAAVGSTVSLKGDAVWLVCADICVPEEASLTLDLPVVAGPAAPSASAAEIAATRERLPLPSPWPATFAVADNVFSVAVFSPELAKAGLKSAVFFPTEGGLIKNAAPQTVEERDGALVVTVEAGRRVATAEKLAKVTAAPGVLVATGSDGKTQAFAFSAQPGAVPGGAAGGEGQLSIWVALLSALAGGLILNLMPCVFPVLSMKALSLAGKGGDVRGARVGGLTYTAGVVVSFVALAGLLIGLREAGQAIGWGFQLQSPLVVSILALLFFAIGLNLMGVFEVGGRIQNFGQSATRKEGPVASFLTGVLAAVVAAPCTAPFMAGAVGTAISQPVPIALAIFAALGLGMALPYLLLSFWPALIRRLPKPGTWMERLKQVLAFPMFGSAVWLLWVLTLQAGANAVALVLGAMVVASFALWLWGLSQRGQGGVTARVFSGLAAAAVVAAVVIVPQTATTASAMAGTETSGPVSEPYTPGRLDALLKEGKPVFVNLTAAWCVTCLWNEESTLSTAAVGAAFQKTGIVYLKGDWTNSDPDITKLLEKFGRAGVPLYLFYAAGKSEPVILPQLLTESIMLEAIGAAAPGA